MLKPHPKQAPDFTLEDADGDAVSLSEILDGGQRVMLVFLRHLG
jgi:peroxiredoxin